MSGTIAYRLDETDLIDAQRAWFRARLRGRLLAVVVGATLVVGAGLLLLDPFPGRQHVALAALPVAGVITGLLVLWAPDYGIRRQAQRVAAQNRAFGLEQRIEWNESTVRLSSDRGESRLAWAEFHRWQLTDRLLLLYLDETQFHVVPLRALGAGQQQEMVERLRAAGVPPIGR